MVSRILNYKSTQIALIGLILLGAILCIFTPNHLFFKNGAAYALQIMFGYLLLGMGFLIFRQPKLMFTSFACCAGLCLTLKYSSNHELKHPARTNEIAFKVAHFNAAETDYDSTVEAILNTNADLISIQELPYDWYGDLKENLGKKYKDQLIYQTLDCYSMAVFSARKILNKDTFLVDKIPNLVGMIDLGNAVEDVHFVCSHTTPPLLSKDLAKMKNQLKEIGEYANKIETPIITLGDYHAPPWWAEIQDLKHIAKLQDSRRSTQQSISNFFNITPYDYIFHSKHLKCIEFESISSVSSSHLGIQGTYQFNSKKDKDNVKTSQKF